MATIVACVAIPYGYLEIEKRQIQAEHAVAQKKAEESMDRKRDEIARKQTVDMANSFYKIEVDAARKIEMLTVESGKSAQLARIECELKISRASAERDARLKQWP